MRCPNPQCNAELEPSDRFCPQCGTSMPAIPTPTSGSARAAMPPTQAPADRRLTAHSVLRRTIEHEGQAYPALLTQASLLVRTGAVLKWILIALGVVYCIYWIAWGVHGGSIGLGLLLGIGCLAANALLAWLLWLGLTVGGELLYLWLDVTKVFIASNRRQ
ncbi:MAG: zinc ribbon domain-containing protein [Actinobacteria bacterium]|nr:zinc ribbon domain-containing protein [Actinomycetota bacterium]